MKFIEGDSKDIADITDFVFCMPSKPFATNRYTLRQTDE